MLHELRVENLLLMERAELALGPGLNILTGETGAGKTLLAQALDLLLGGRARSGIVRAAAPEAYVEGVFSVPEQLPETLKERIPDDSDELVLARRVWRDGRTRAYICRRSATLAELRELGARLLAFYGQHEHRKLMLANAQLEILDSHCGAQQLELRGRARAAYGQVRMIEQRLEELRALAGARERELDLVRFELEEIEAASVSEEEERELLAERERLRHAETLRAAAAAGAEALSGEQGGGAVELLAGAARPLAGAAEIDTSLAPLAERLEGLRFEAEDLAQELRAYLLEAEGDPGRLEEVEERLALLARLARKHGGTIADVLAHAERCRSRSSQLEHAEVALEHAEAELVEAQTQLRGLADQLGQNRAAGAKTLAQAVKARLAELAMPDAQFEVHLRPRPDGHGPNGAEVVEFSLAPNAGLQAGPLREIASGGELSRVMLALLSAAHAGAGNKEQPLLVFDEVDAGIGGHTARAVGEHLKSLASRRQVLCITHLPQVAALGDRHFTIVKEPDAIPARTTVSSLQGDAVVGELVRMLGAAEHDRAAAEHARTLLRAA